MTPAERQAFFDAKHLAAMRQTGWWQLSQSQSTVGSGTSDGNYRFISYIPRDDKETLVAPVPPQCDCD